MRLEIIYNSTVDKNTYLLRINIYVNVSDREYFLNSFIIEKYLKNFFKKYNGQNLGNGQYYINVWFLNFLLFYLSRYENIIINDNQINIEIDDNNIQNEIISFKKIEDIFDNNKDIYNWIDNEIDNNPTLIKNKYLFNILTNKLKTKYDYLIQATNFDLL